jgi:serine/threonine protein kinase
MFSENYSVCLNDDGSPREIARSGPVVTYKAIGYDSGRVVAMQLIPLTSIDEVERVRFEENARTAQKLDNTNLARVFDVGVEHDHLAFVSEYLEGETADAWVRAHGPMPADAVLRIGLQVMNVLAEAATHSLTHRSIQPANLMILPGVAFDGGWPRIKLLNFGLGGLKVQSDNSETHELAPSLHPEFSSPEQLENKPVDFRSDIFSLGAAMWFLLTGSAPSALPTTESGPRLSAPTGAVPRFVRNLVSRMVRTNPEERPQDPAAFAEKIHACLQKAERQTAFTRSFAPAAIPTIPTREKKRIAPVLALAAIAVLASLGAFYFVRSQRESKPLGVIIGVPETAEASSLPVTASASPSPVIKEAAEQPGLVAQQSPAHSASSVATGVAAASASAAPVISQTTQQSGLLAQQSPTAPAVTADSVSPMPQLAANNRVAEPPIPAEGPSEAGQPPISTETPPAGKSESSPSDLSDRAATAAKDSLPTNAAANAQPPSSSEQVASTRKRDDLLDRAATAAKDSLPTTASGNEQSPSSSEQVTTTAKRDDFSASKTKSRHQPLAKSSLRRSLPPLRVGSKSARVLATTPAGNLILRLPSGRTVVTPPVPNIDDAPVISHRRVRRVVRPIPLEDEPPVVVLPPNF